MHLLSANSGIPQGAIDTFGNSALDRHKSKEMLTTISFFAVLD